MLSILLIGIGLSMDAFAVSITNCLTMKRFRLRDALLMSLYFGGFQFLMPLLGYLLGSTVSDYVSAYGPYISFFLLAFIGGKMLWEALRGENGECPVTLTHGKLLVLAVATSLDALAVGVSFAFMDVKLLPACALIGCTTFVICLLGSLLGSRIRFITGRRAGVLGGLVLIGIGVKLLLQGIS